MMIIITKTVLLNLLLEVLTNGSNIILKEAEKNVISLHWMFSPLWVKSLLLLY